MYMLRTKNVISKLHEVPNTWIFENYLSLPERLNGQDVKIKSAFNPKDKQPSMFIYFNIAQAVYKYKDFSGDKQGDGVQLVKELYHIEDRFEAAERIIKDYNTYLSSNKGIYQPLEFIEHAKFKLESFKLRNWNTTDQKYWIKFTIGSKLLKHYIVQPLLEFVLRKNGYENTMVLNSSRIYGFFKKDGSLYKIYQPLKKNNKFFKVESHTQGLEQLTYKKPYLGILSSMKDMMAFDTMGFTNAEVIAPDSESTTLPAELINDLKSKYKVVFTLFDNDEAGLKAMKKYKEEFDLPYVHLKLEGDLAEASEVHGVPNVRENLYPLLTKVLTGTAKELP